MPPTSDDARFSELEHLAIKRFAELTDPEALLLRRVCSGDDKESTESHDRPTIRAEVVRWLIADRAAWPYIDPLGVRLANVTFAEALNLNSCDPPFPVEFEYCTFKSVLSFREAFAPFIRLFSCTTNDQILAGGLRTTEDLFLRNHQADHEIELLGVKIGGDLDCDGSRFLGLGDALSADRAMIGGEVFLRGIQSAGTIRFLGSELSGNLEMKGAQFTRPDTMLSLDSAKIKGNIYLNGLFSCPGVIRLRGAQIGGEINCNSAQIGSIVCDGMSASGSLTWTNIRRSQSGNKAKLRLFGATVGALYDDHESWPDQGDLHVLDFVYQDLVLHDSTTSDLVQSKVWNRVFSLNSKDRIEWLELQPKAEQEYAQPWMQLSKLLQNSGDDKGAKHVLYVYHRLRAQTSNPLLRVGSWPYHRLQEDPLWVGFPIASLGILGSFIFWRAKRMQAMVPTDKEVRKEFRDSGKLLAGYPPFNPVIYTIENVLPVVKLGQDAAWTPDHQVETGSWIPERPQWLRTLSSRWILTRFLSRLSYRRLAVLRWALILLGWALALILAAAIGSQFKS
jgi:hypothetical protein